MFDPDTDEDFYQEHTDVACPECDHVEAVVPDVLGFYSRRRPHNVTWSFWCDECGHEWTVNEDLRPEAPRPRARTDMAVTVTLTKEQVEALLDVLSYGEDYLESRIEDNEATAPRHRPRWWRRDKTTLKHAVAARRAIVMARRD